MSAWAECSSVHIVFIAEEGPECFSDKSDAIHECVSKTFNKYNESIPTNVDKIPNFIIKEDNCRDMDKLEVCIVAELEQCKESTPANLVEALFRFVRKETPCKNYPKTAKSEVNNANIKKMTIEVIVGTWIMAFIAKFIISTQ